ncbi:MAG: hypothetical protein EZS28_007595 [Streblomastix strix]|uniref:Uncharacterized protein n=1 Tax=Streblomastix strix TaxID=222440 RepID=A0A5J4WR64_9EUKA|nr:MAG: hypothetical protein EZS28_007595 [Streblomastix strix]
MSGLEEEFDWLGVDLWLSFFGYGVVFITFNELLIFSAHLDLQQLQITDSGSNSVSLLVMGEDEGKGGV